MKFAFLVTIVTAWVMLIAHNVQAGESTLQELSVEIAHIADQGADRCMLRPIWKYADCWRTTQASIERLAATATMDPDVEKIKKAWFACHVSSPGVQAFNETNPDDGSAHAIDCVTNWLNGQEVPL